MDFWLSLAYEPCSQLLDLARMGEELGFEGVFLPDHLVIPDRERTPHPGGWLVSAEDEFPEPLITFAAMAAVTTRLRFLTSVLVVPLRDPFLLAKQIGTLAVISDNRFILGTGVGWLREEFQVVGRDWESRGQRLDEMLNILLDFWDDGFADYHGRHYVFERSGMFPSPTARILIWIGGHSLTAARRAARFDGYVPMMGLDEETRRQFALVERLRAEEGRTGPFDRIITWPGGNDPSLVEPLAVRDGITKTIVAPWGLNAMNLSLNKKRASAEAFADAVIRG